MSINRGVFALFLLLPAGALAMQLQLTRPELCQLSHHVVVAEVTDISTQWTADEGGGIERIAHVAVSDVVRGEQTKQLELVLPGGRMGELAQVVEDVPNLVTNGNYLLFVAPNMAGQLNVIGGDDGAVRITPTGAKVGETLKDALASVEVCRAN